MDKLETKECWVKKQPDSKFGIGDLEKRTDLYLFTKQELIEIFGRNFNAGRFFQQSHPGYPNRETYIKQLLK